MIISHRHRFIFFAIPKTGTHSVRQALRRHMAEDDLEQVGLFVQKRFPYPELKDIGHGHISARQIAPVLDPEVFTAYFKFAFVRNPFERFVSYCAFMGRKDDQFLNAPREFMKWILFERKPFDHVLFLTQHEFIADTENRLALDYVGRNESMQTGYDAICAHLGIPGETLARANASQHRPYREYYDRELADAVAEFYRKDFELFDYPLDLDAR